MLGAEGTTVGRTGVLVADRLADTRMGFEASPGHTRRRHARGGYVERRTHEGLAKPEIIRCLKRYAARKIYNTLNLATPAR
jgi:hypothetical protein